jgi:tetratricopeptide (TPR) repeat protein
MTLSFLLDPITETLQESGLSWMLPNLRQDLNVWASLNDPKFFEQLEQSKPDQSTYLAQDFSPAKLALLAVRQADFWGLTIPESFDGVNEQLIDMAIRKSEEGAFFRRVPQDLATAGVMALTLFAKHTRNNTWQSLLEALDQSDVQIWLTPLACLYGYLEHPTGLLRALVQPGAGSVRYQIAVHALLSNPIAWDEQLTILMSLCHGSSHDPLPPTDRLELLGELSEQRPQMAQDFCKKWFEIYPADLELSHKRLSTPETINRLAENLFQIEAKRICGDQAALAGLIEQEKILSLRLQDTLLLQQLSLSAKNPAEKTTSDEYLELVQNSLQSTKTLSSDGNSSHKTASLALSLMEAGLVDEAQAILADTEAHLLDNFELLYAITRVAREAGNQQRANEAAARLVSLWEKHQGSNGILVWGDEFSLVNLGKTLLSLNNAEAACKVFETAAQACPSDPILLHLLAECYSVARKYPEKVNTLQLILALNPSDIDDRRDLAGALEELNDWEASLKERRVILEMAERKGNAPKTQDQYAFAHAALKARHPELTLKACSEILAKNQEDGQALVYAGEAHLALDEFEQGLEMLTLATQVAPQMAGAWLALASAQKNRVPNAAVIEILKAAAQSVPDSALIHFGLGELYLQDNTPSLALPELEQAVKLAPDNPQILVSYGQVLSMLGHLEGGREALSKAFAIEPAFPGLAEAYARLLVELGRQEEAIAPYELLLTLNPEGKADARLEYARCVLNLIGNRTSSQSPMKALIALNEVLQADPENAEAKALTAEALSANGEYELAFQAFREALDTSLIQDNTWFERLSYGFGCAASSIGKHDIAIAALQEAGQANPGNPTIFKSLSDVYISADLPDEALRAARTVLVIDGENPDQLSWFAGQAAKLIKVVNSHHTNSGTTETRQAPEEALNALAKAIQLAPTRSDLIVQLGNFQSSLEEHAEAQKIFASLAAHEFATRNDLKIAAGYLSLHEDHPSAIACLEKGTLLDESLSEGHDPSLYTLLAQEYVTHHDPSAAINTLDRAIELFPHESSLLSEKIKILLSLGQPLEALAVIDTGLEANLAGEAKYDLLFLGSRIERTIGDLPEAAKYARLGVMAQTKEYSVKNISHLALRYRTQLAEILRLLLQPEKAYQVLDSEPETGGKHSTDAQDYLDFICLHTELALETGERIREGILEISLEASHPCFSRLMAINARLMNKAGNTKQALQLFQLAVKHNPQHGEVKSSADWSAAYMRDLNLISLIEAAQELSLWNEAWNLTQQYAARAEAEPLPHLHLARITIRKAEFNQLCDLFEVSQHKPKVNEQPEQAISACTDYLGRAKSNLEALQAHSPIPQYEITQDQIYRWQARAANLIPAKDGIALEPNEILANQQTTDDLVSWLNQLYKTHHNDPDGACLPKIIKLARQFPRNPAIVLQVALVLQENNPEEAMKSLQGVIEHNPSAKNPAMAFCNILLAKTADELGQYKLAQNAVESALDFWPDEPAWHSLAARIYKHSGEIQAGIQHLAAATELAPELHASHFELGQTYFENAHEDPDILALALQSMLRAESLKPNHIDSRVILANIQYQLHQLDEAEESARQVLLQEPDRADIYQLLSQVAIQKEDFQGAYEYATKAMQISPKDIQSTITLAKALSALGRNSEALARLNTLISTAPEARLQLERVNLINKISGPRAAIEELNQLTGSYPDDFLMLNALSKAFIEVGEPENAVRTAQQALNVCNEKTSPHEIASLHLLIGQILRQAGQLDQAIQHLSDAIKFSPNRLEPYLELGLARKERREYQQALQVFERATQVAPNDPRAPYEAGLALKESKDYKTSETMLRRAVSLAPNDLLIRRQLAAVVALNLVHNPRSGRNNPTP